MYTHMLSNTTKKKKKMRMMMIKRHLHVRSVNPQVNSAYVCRSNHPFFSFLFIFFNITYFLLKMVTRTKKIFVGGLSANTTVEDVKKYFEQYGKVTENAFKEQKNKIKSSIFSSFSSGRRCNVND